ncbi:MAG: 3-hydroxyacyl-ACP dehydratase FabZ [Tenericutes bacterium]|jgi:3-hydroxyacyl-[acyl-carrier-protein] dehydratase|nr:3-hydroxyacyl-ACP dehydratase FabZ [Mycoplasmatota bacterium]
MKLNKEEIKQIIPHRHPFLFLDEIIELESLKYGVGVKYVTEDDYFFEGHFPGKPVMPGVLIIESLAQVGAVILLSDPQYKNNIAYFTGIQKAKFRKSVVPGDKLILKCELTKIRKSFGFGLARAYVNDQLVCEAEISFAIGEL